MADEEMVSISKKELDKLKEDSNLLECLRAQGVDNWDGWDDAIEMANGG